MITFAIYFLRQKRVKKRQNGESWENWIMEGSCTSVCQFGLLKRMPDPYTHCVRLFHYISTNAKHPRLENLYKMPINYLHRMAQAT